MSKENMEYLDKYDYLLKVLTEEIDIDGKKVRLKDDFEKFFIKAFCALENIINRFYSEYKLQYKVFAHIIGNLKKL